MCICIFGLRVLSVVKCAATSTLLVCSTVPKRTVIPVFHCSRSRAVTCRRARATAEGVLGRVKGGLRNSEKPQKEGGAKGFLAPNPSSFCDGRGYHCTFITFDITFATIVITYAIVMVMIIIIIDIFVLVCATYSIPLRIFSLHFTFALLYINFQSFSLAYCLIPFYLVQRLQEAMMADISSYLTYAVSFEILGTTPFVALYKA